MDKDHIIQTIQRTARENGGAPLGRSAFETETKVGTKDWLGIHWAKWGDALINAGFEPIHQPSDESYALRQMAALIRRLQKFPTLAECRQHPKTDNAFPCVYTIQRLGLKHECAARVIEYCRSHDGFDDVISICEPVAGVRGQQSREVW